MRTKFLIASLLALLVGMPAQASGKKEEKAVVVEGVQYVYLDPVFMVNFGETGRLRYLRTQIAVKVANSEAASKVNEFLPYLRNDMILILSAQSAEIINTPQGREALRKMALDNLRGRMMKLAEQPYIDELYFSNFVTQG
ncbi:MAG: hypothetical protein RL217_1242 [Pseudomonadota bacterium]|jgi:flagellar FliL protein